MAENIFIKKRQRQRLKDGFVTFKLILRLIVASVLLLLGFLYFVGDPTTTLCENGCESEFSLGIWVLGFALIFGGIILLGGLVGGLVAFLRWTRGGSGGAMTSLIDKNKSDP